LPARARAPAPGSPGVAARLLVITGTPGAGKTTLARALAGSTPDGLHLDSDVFYRFPAHPLDPSRPGSQAQNTAIVRALGAAAGEFLRAGYRVVLDGIVGPWFLTTLRAALPPGTTLDYVVLALPLDEALARVRARDGAGPSPVVETMHAAFRELGPFASHRVDAAGLAPDELARRVGDGLEAGRFRLA
jgi:predicted kinase